MKTCQGETSKRASERRQGLFSESAGREHEFGSKDEQSQLYQRLFSLVCRDPRVPLAALEKLFLRYFGRPVV